MLSAKPIVGVGSIANTTGQITAIAGIGSVGSGELKPIYGRGGVNGK